MKSWEPTCTVETLRLRAGILETVRRFFADRGVLEVQTPTLGLTSVSDVQIESLRTTGGEFLQTSPEYYMKRLLTAGAPSIFQIGPAYRAGESGRHHLTEFTLVEWYRLGFDDEALMVEVAGLVDCVLGPEPYDRLTYAELLALRPDDGSDPDLRFVAALEGLGDRRVFITDYPADQAALARLKAGNPAAGELQAPGIPKLKAFSSEGQTPRAPRLKALPGEPQAPRAPLAARFELVVGGLELANGYHELTDADELSKRMQRDNRRRREQGKPEMEPDERLLAAMRHGLPDCAGVALGLDRLVMLAAGASSIAEVVPFADS